MKRLLGVCAAVVFLDSVFFAALVPLLPSLTREFGLNSSQAGLLSGSYGAGVLTMAVPSGWFAARHGARRAVLIGLVGMGIFSPLFGFASSLWLLDSARFLQGASGALMWSGAMSWVIVRGPDQRRGAFLGLLVAAATVGELMGAPLGALAHAVGFEYVFGAVGVISAILFMLTWTLPVPATQAIEPLRSTIGSAVNSRLPLVLWLLASASIAFGAVSVIAPLRLDLLGAGAGMIAGAFAIGSVVETLLGPQIGHLSDRIGRIIPFRAGALLGAIALLAMVLVDARWLVFSAVVLFAFAAGLAFAPAMALTADTAERAGVAQGYASGLTNVAFGGGQMIGAIGAGLLAMVGQLLPAVAAALLLVMAAVTAAGAERSSAQTT